MENLGTDIRMLVFFSPFFQPLCVCRIEPELKLMRYPDSELSVYVDQHSIYQSTSMLVSRLTYSMLIELLYVNQLFDVDGTSVLINIQQICFLRTLQP